MSRIWMPDNTRPPGASSTLTAARPFRVKATMHAVEELARARGIVYFRVEYKRNVREEHVVALIFPLQSG